MADGKQRGTKEEARSSESVAEVRPDSDRQERSPAAESRGEYLGLCANCELRETCEKPKLPGGIWSCNDYSEL